MIFVARQLIEKANEHGDALFILFIDLQKAYDSVPQQACGRFCRSVESLQPYCISLGHSMMVCMQKSDWVTQSQPV